MYIDINTYFNFFYLIEKTVSNLTYYTIYFKNEKDSFFLLLFKIQKPIRRKVGGGGVMSFLFFVFGNWNKQRENGRI